MTDLYRGQHRHLRRAVVELHKRALVATLPAKGTYVIGRPEAAEDSPEESEPKD